MTMPPKVRLTYVYTLVTCLVFTALVFGCDFPGKPRPSEVTVGLDIDDANAIRHAYEEGHSDVWVQSQGRVIRVLPDDKKGDRHQRFMLRLNHGQTLLISHNIDIAPRIDSLSVGDTVYFRGEYEWNDKGGVIHWTHHDPSYRQPGGFLVHEGLQYH